MADPGGTSGARKKAGGGPLAPSGMAGGLRGAGAMLPAPEGLKLFSVAMCVAVRLQSNRF